MYIDDKFVKEYGGLVKDLLLRAKLQGEAFDRCWAAVWVRVLASDNYDAEKASISTWLWYVARSAIGNELKKMNRSTDALDHATLSLEDANNYIGPEDAGTDADELDRIFKGARLSERDEAIMRDIHLEEMTYEEAAEKYSMELEAVKKVAYRAMMALRDTVA